MEGQAMTQGTMWPGWWYRLPDGRELLALSIDHDAEIARIMWRSGEHADMDISSLQGWREIGKAGKPVTDHTKLRKLVEAAQPGPCTHNCYDGYGGANRNCYGRRKAFHEMIEALSDPTTILALLDEIEAMRAVCEAAEGWLEQTGMDWNRKQGSRFGADNHRLADAVDALRAARRSK
jgi:hypothetical protein